MIRNLFFIFMGIFLFASQTLKGQNNVQDAEVKVHGIFIYNFTKYINWPEEYNSGDFTLAVLGETTLLDELQRMVGSMNTKSRKIIVKKYKNPEEIDNKCHLLYITTANSHMLGKVLLKSKGKPTLIITNKEGLGKAGSMINFVFHNDKIRFEINTNSMNEHQLKCAQQLKVLAIEL